MGVLKASSQWGTLTPPSLGLRGTPVVILGPNLHQWDEPWRDALGLDADGLLGPGPFRALTLCHTAGAAKVHDDLLCAGHCAEHFPSEAAATSATFGGTVAICWWGHGWGGM